MDKITAPGIYDLPIEEYHAQPCDGPSISASGLRTLLLQCPAKYFAHSPLNPERFERTSAALNFGRAAHALALGVPEFEKYFVVSPFDDFRNNLSKAWREKQTKTVVSAQDHKTILAMVAAVKGNPATAGAFQGEGTPEMSIAWKDEVTGVWLLSRPDWLPTDVTKLFCREYKTAATIEPRVLATKAFAFGYDMQAALVVHGLRSVLQTSPLGVAHIVQEKKPPYLCDFPMFDPDQIAIGAERVRAALDIFARCYDAHIAGKNTYEAWPGYHDQPYHFKTPRWLTGENTEQMTNVRSDEYDY